MKKTLFLIALITFNLNTYAQTSSVESTISLSDSGKNWLLNSKENINFHQLKDGSSYLELSNVKNEKADFSLTFEDENELLNPNYILQNNMPVINSNISHSGQKSAMFYNNKIDFNVSDKSMFGKDGSDFTIEFWIMPTKTSNGSIIFEYNAQTVINGRQVNQSITCSFVRESLYWQFNNIFFDDNKIDSVSMELSSAPLRTGEWRRHTIKYNSDLGILELLDNDTTTDLQYTNPKNKEDALVFLPSFKRGINKFLSIGSFSGYLDDISISDEYSNNVISSKYNMNGTIVSSPINLNDGDFLGAEIIAESPSNSFFKKHIRFANFKEELASENSNTIPWQEFDSNADYSSVSKKFIQFKLELFAGDSNNVSPIIKDIIVSYRTIPAPPRPAKVMVTKKGNGILITWHKMVGFDIKGYKIYFGKTSKEYFGQTERYVSPVDVGNTTELFIDNIDISSLYYFAISAYDGSSIRKESSLSEETFYKPS